MNRFKYQITATDETAKGVGSAEKRMGGLTKAVNRYGKAAKSATKDGPGTKSGLTHVKGAMDQVQRATVKLADTVPGLNRYTSTLGDVHRAAADAAKGFQEARESGSGLTSALGGFAALGGGAIGVMAALAAGAVKLASGWAEGGAQLGRLSAGIGVSTDDLQKFQAAGEQFGVSKEETTAALGGVGQTLHDASWGLNPRAAGALNQLHLAVKRGKDGLPDISAFMSDLSDRISKQKDPYTQSQIAEVFGASSALPMLRQGSGAVISALDWATKNAAIRTPGDVTRGGADWRKGVMVGQVAGKAGLAAERAAGIATEPGLNAALSGGEGASAALNRYGVAGIASAGVVALGGAAKLAGGELARAAGQVAAFGGVVSGAMGRLERAALEGQKKTGVPALVTVAQADLESGGLKHMPPGSNNPFGIKAGAGEPYVEAWTHETVNGRSERVLAKFRKYASLEEAVAAHDDLLAHGRPYATARGKMADPYAFASAISQHYATDRNYDQKLTGEMHRVEVHVYDHKTTAKVIYKGTEKAVAVGKASVGSIP